MEFRDYYQMLGVGREAPAEEIKRAYRKLARKYHPDVSKEKDAEQRMQEVNEAYQVLSDPAKRAAYDRLGSGPQPGQDFRPPPGWDSGVEFSSAGGRGGGGAGYSDFFEELFGRMGGRMHRAARGAADHYARMVMDIEDSLTGATRQIALRAPHEDAAGKVVLQERTLNVKIPKGIREGQHIRLAGQGGLDNGSPAGDLLLEVQFARHPRLRADGRDLHLALPIAPWEAALGAEVPVRLPGTELRVRIPEGAQSGKQLRLRGRGIPSQPPGDLYLDLQIVVPPASTPKTRELYETMARETRFDPRAAVN